MLRSHLCEYSDPYIVGKGAIDLLAFDANENNKAQKINAFKSNVPYRSCISKISSILIDKSEVFYIVMPMYNLLEYSQKLFHDIRKFMELLWRRNWQC